MKKDILFGIMIFGIFLITNVSAAWIDMKDGFSVSSAGADNPSGIVTNNSDFWIVDNTDKFTYHFNKTGGNYTSAGPVSSVNAIGEEGFSTVAAGSTFPRGLTTNITSGTPTDFWITDGLDLFVYHFDKNGNNQSDGFKVNSAGVGNPQGITTNNSDFWIIDVNDVFVYHFNSAGINQTDGFSVSSAGVGQSSLSGITTNNSDFWIVDNIDKFIYHFNKMGVNQTDGFSILDSGSNLPRGITTNITSGTPTDFWIVDASRLLVYHFFNDIINPNINIIFPTQNNTNTTNINLNINYTFSDNIVVNSTWYSNDTYSINRSLGSGGTYFNITNITWSEGLHNVTVYTNDSANNLNFSTISFTIDTTSPTASAVCSPNSVHTGDTVTCSCSPSDTLSGINTSATSMTENPSTSNTGTFSVSCSFADYTGNTGSTTATYTVEQGGSGSGTSMGSGGGSIGTSDSSQTTEEIEPITEKKYTLDSIAPESIETIFDFDSEALIKEIQIQVKEQTQNVEINVATYDEKPNELAKEKEGIVYRYLKIDVVNLEDKLEKAKIKFQIKKNSSDEDFDKNEIALFKFNETSEMWNELNTSYTNEDENYYYYQTELTSFSYFAIGKKVVQKEIVEEKTGKGFEISSKMIKYVIFFVLAILALAIIILLLIKLFIKNRREKPKIRRSSLRKNRIPYQKPVDLLGKDFNKCFLSIYII